MYTSWSNNEVQIGIYLAVAANWKRAAYAAVGKQVVITLCTILRVLFHYILFPKQGVFAVMTVKTLAARHPAFDLFSYSAKEKKFWWEERAEKMKKEKKSLVNSLAIYSTCCPWKEIRIALANCTSFYSERGWDLNWQSRQGWEGGEAGLGVSTGGIFYKY